MRYALLIVNREREMIQSFKDRKTEAVFRGEAPKGIPPDLLKAIRRRLQALDAAILVTDLKVPPGNGLHPLTEDRKGQWAIKVNDQFRICFEWDESGPQNVEFTDYH